MKKIHFVTFFVRRCRYNHDMMTTSIFAKARRAGVGDKPGEEYELEIETWGLSDLAHEFQAAQNAALRQAVVRHRTHESTLRQAADMMLQERKKEG